MITQAEQSLLNNLLYTSITDYSTFGSMNIYDHNNSLLSSFVCGISPGQIVFDIRSSATGISLVNIDTFDKVSSKNYDMLGRVIDNNRFMKDGLSIKDNKLFFLIK